MASHSPSGDPSSFTVSNLSAGSADCGIHDTSNDENPPQIGSTMPDRRSDDNDNENFVSEDHFSSELSITALEADHADLAPTAAARIPDASEPSLDRISLDSTINGGSHVHQHSGHTSTHSAIPVLWASQAHDTTQADESQPLSGKPPPLAKNIHPPSLKEIFIRSYWQSWWLEILSSLLALSSLIAMITILAIHQGQPLPKWPGLISINSLIAIFTTVFKASLIMPVAEGLGQLKWEWFRSPRYLTDIAIFDNASRGPWGSILLIVGQIRRSEKTFLAGLGALVTILALAVDTLSQAMVQHRPCVREMENGVPQLARTNIYIQHDNAGRDQPEAALSETMIDAIYKGLSYPQEVSTLVDFKCSTGNCTFGQHSGGAFFSSLAVCPSCYDISDEIFTNKSLRAWILPSGAEVIDRKDHNTYSAVKTPPEYFGNDQPPLYGFDAIWFQRHNKWVDGCSNHCNMTFAVRCRLDVCVETYHGEVRNGIYNETKHSEKRLKRPSQGSSPFRGGITESIIIDGLERPCPETSDPSYSYNVSIPWTYYPVECLWGVDLASSFGLTTVRDHLLIDNILYFGESGKSAVTGFIWSRRIFANGHGNISTAEEVVRGVANSITAEMRNRPGWDDEAVPTSFKYASGKTFIMETCIYVEWCWLAYPLALLVLQWIFSALVLVKGWKVRKTGEERMAWKTSPIALLFHGLDEDLREKNGDLTSLRQMDGVSEKLRVQLAPADGQKRKGWRFCES